MCFKLVWQCKGKVKLYDGGLKSWEGGENFDLLRGTKMEKNVQIDARLTPKVMPSSLLH